MVISVNKPFFCVFEGIDGVGKGTQLFLLEQYLKSKNLSVITTKEPTQTLTGYFLKIVLKMGNINPLTDAFLFAADRSEHVEKLILPALQKNNIILCERYLYSSIAYQATCESIDESFIKRINSFAIKPDLVILLDADPEITIKRKKNVLHYQGEKFENIEFLKTVRDKYHTLAKEHNFRIIDANRTIEDIHKEIVKVFNFYYKRKEFQLKINRFIEYEPNK